MSLLPGCLRWPSALWAMSHTHTLVVVGRLLQHPSPFPQIGRHARILRASVLPDLSELQEGRSLSSLISRASMLQGTGGAAQSLA